MYFTTDNCDFNSRQREVANAFVVAWLNDHGVDGSDEDDVKNASDAASNHITTENVQ